MPAPLYPPREDGNTALCRVPGCDRIKYRGTTMCGKHWSERYSNPQRPIRAADRDGQGRKYCFGCRVWQEVSNFHKGSAKHMDGLKARCKKCSSREYRARTYGISAEKMDAMLKEQGGICAVCGIDPDHKWAVDHDHSCCPGTKSCGRCVRGILCDRCNTAIGTLGDNSEAVMRAVDYLRAYEQRVVR